LPDPRITLTASRCGRYTHLSGTCKNVPQRFSRDRQSPEEAMRDFGSWSRPTAISRRLPRVAELICGRLEDVHAVGLLPTDLPSPSTSGSWPRPGTRRQPAHPDRPRGGTPTTSPSRRRAACRRPSSSPASTWPSSSRRSRASTRSTANPWSVSSRAVARPSSARASCSRRDGRDGGSCAGLEDPAAIDRSRARPHRASSPAAEDAMALKLVRVDDRLIHGQVVRSGSRRLVRSHCHRRRPTAQDAFLKEVLMLAAPRG
jgi:hypothetical protein